MILAVLFDFDGVIVRSEPLHKRTFMELLSPYGVEVSDERWYREFAGTGSKRIFKALADEYGVEVDIEELVSKRRGVFVEHAKKGELGMMPGLMALLDSLKQKGIKMAIVSGGHRDYIEVLMDMLGLRDYFSAVVSAEDIKERKPDPGPFLHGAEALGIAPENCLVIEDSISGCKAARAAGMKLIWIRPDPSVDAPECDLEVDDLQDKRILELVSQ
jgi:HAD superfamily hydrolase (TIGR01509 family)